LPERPALVAMREAPMAAKHAWRARRSLCCGQRRQATTGSTVDGWIHRHAFVAGLRAIARRIAQLDAQPNDVIERQEAKHVAAVQLTTARRIKLTEARAERRITKELADFTGALRVGRASPTRGDGGRFDTGARDRITHVIAAISVDAASCLCIHACARQLVAHLIDAIVVTLAFGWRRRIDAEARIQIASAAGAVSLGVALRPAEADTGVPQLGTGQRITTPAVVGRVELTASQTKRARIVAETQRARLRARRIGRTRRAAISPRRATPGAKRIVIRSDAHESSAAVGVRLAAAPSDSVGWNRAAVRRRLGIYRHERPHTHARAPALGLSHADRARLQAIRIDVAQLEAQPAIPLTFARDLWQKAGGADAGLAAVEAAALDADRAEGRAEPPGLRRRSHTDAAPAFLRRLASAADGLSERRLVRAQARPEITAPPPTRRIALTEGHTNTELWIRARLLAAERGNRHAHDIGAVETLGFAGCRLFRLTGADADILARHHRARSQ